ncbi:MAG: isochorismatase family protein [Synergistaceae bacterium]|nr:isochorismatase family protein [Synergistaceae bacterium]
MSGKCSGALVIIYPQNDFCDCGGSLYVDGAEGDIVRLARHISREGGKYSGVFVSLDSHDSIAIFHPKFWLCESGSTPAPFTAITEDDYRLGRFRTSRPEHGGYAERMFGAMARKNIPSIMVWPEHCVVSTWGHAIAEPLKDALGVWRAASGKPVRYIFKGENPYTEQFSVFEGLDDLWPDTAFNKTLCSALAGYESVTFAGEALSHCVEASITSYVGHGGDAVSRQPKFVLSDCVSPVAGFGRDSSTRRLEALGVVLIPSDE